MEIIGMPNISNATGMMASVESFGAASDFVAAFDALAQAVRRARGANGRTAEVGLTLSQYGLLEVLAEQPSARVQELAAHAGITASTATRILDGLERREIVRRARSDEDRRAVTVSLTDAGQVLVQAEQEWLRGRQRAFYAALPPAEQELAPDLLLRLAALIDGLAAGPGQ
jgi:DNA-binding MarR family transcriptional regulator